MKNRYKLGLPKNLWWAAYAATHELRTGIPEAFLDREADLTAYYSPSVTPDQGVTADMVKYGLEPLD